MEYILMKMPMGQIVKKENSFDDWKIKEDRDGIDMVFYKDIPVDEIIYSVGELSLAMAASRLHELQQEYYDMEMSDLFNISLKLIRDNSFSKTFYTMQQALSERL